MKEQVYSILITLKDFCIKFLVLEILGTVLSSWFLILALSKLNKIYPNLYNLLSEHKKSIPSLKLKSLEIVPANEIYSLSKLALGIIHGIITLCFVGTYFILVFSFFPATRKITLNYMSYLGSLIKMFSISAISFLPNVFSMAIIIIAAIYLLKFIRLIALEVHRERITFNGFYPEWAIPTYKILRFIIIVLSAIMIAPYLPGFESPAFKGFSIFFGVLLSLGSTSAIANVIAGVVLVYMRAFNIGDRIKAGDVTGDVVEKSLLVTKIRTTKNVEVTIPNAAILASPSYNYSLYSNEPGLILNTTVTIGYDVPWDKVHGLLIAAALNTSEILNDPKPFVLQKSLNDSNVSYEINAYTNNPNKVDFTYSELHQNIQDSFNDAEVEIMSPIYSALRDGNESTIPGSTDSTRKFKFSNSL